MHCFNQVTFTLANSLSLSLSLSLFTHKCKHWVSPFYSCLLSLCVWLRVQARWVALVSVHFSMMQWGAVKWWRRKRRSQFRQIFFLLSLACVWLALIHLSCLYVCVWPCIVLFFLSHPPLDSWEACESGHWLLFPCHWETLFLSLSVKQPHHSWFSQAIAWLAKY